MKYRGYTLEIHYLPGANFRVDSSGRVIPRNPQTKHVDYVEAISREGIKFRASSIREAKKIVTEIEKVWPEDRINKEAVKINRRKLTQSQQPAKFLENRQKLPGITEVSERSVSGTEAAQ